MRLAEYRSKRNLSKSHEPSGGKPKKSASTLSFCIQKHAARRLHYDFRLEYKGILLSWAVPKGPSLDPEDKRLAIKVEDHPLDYQYFEGIIPKGHYGAGTVEIWDNGTYTMWEAKTREEIEKNLEKGLKEGHFNIIINGKKLKGEFVFQKLKKNDPEDNTWLLIKKKDSYVSSDREEHFKKVKMPDFIPPMLATSVNKPFDSDEWLFEIKWDGYRALAFIDHGKVQLKSRTNHLWNGKFTAVIDNLKKIDSKVIFDGELVVLDSAGRPDFQLMQNYQRDKKGNLIYYVFDLLYKDGKDLRQIPLIKRKEILKNYLSQLKPPLVRYSDHILKEGESFFKEAAKAKLEGIIGKKISSTYQSRRTREWVKIKTSLRQEVVIGGFTEPRGTRKKFGALLIGFYNDEGELIYAGHVGGGFDETLLNDVYNQLKPLIQKKSPFKTPPKPNMPVTWLKPQLVCEVAFAEWTKENIMRQPIFQGLRIDKEPKTIKKEIISDVPRNVETTEKEKKKLDISLTNLDKVYWPKEKYTKGDLIEYYKNIAPYILPYLKNRPVMLHRYPEGITGIDFYQKNLESCPNWIKTFPIKQEGKIINYLIINDLKSLIYAINLGSIDLHPFLSVYNKLQNPDFCVIDLDPHDISFDKVIEAALEVHQILDKIAIKHYCKTSGGKGLHLFIPLHGKYDYEQSRQFAEIISLCVHKQLPHTTSLERDPQKRQKKIYLDCLQNRIAQSIAAPYSVRPRPGALVSTPLDWNEVNKDLDPTAFNLKTIQKRLETKGDIFKPVLGAGVNIKSALSRLKKLL